MKDFRIVHARSLLRLTSFAPVRNFSPASIIVTGTDLNYTAEILYNGILATEFAILSSTRMVVRVPPSQIGKDLTDLRVFASRPIQNADATVVLELSKPVQSLSGMDRLIQSWLIVFLTTPGSDVFSPASGGGARAIIGAPTDSKNKSASEGLTLAIQRTEAELLRLQAGKKYIPPQEKLLSSSLETITYDDATGTISARVQLRNMVSESASIALG